MAIEKVLIELDVNDKATEIINKRLDALNIKVSKLATQINSSGNQVNSNMDKLNDTLNTTAKNTEQVENKMSKLKVGFNKFNSVVKDNALQIASLGANIVSLSNAYRGMIDSQRDVIRTQKDLENLKKEEAELTQEINKLTSEGKNNTEDYAKAVEKLEEVQFKLKITQDDLASKQLKLKNDTATFYLSVIPTSITAISTLTSALGSLNLSFSKITNALKIFRIASISAFITNPIGIAVIGISTLIGLLAFNVGGLKDRMIELGGFILDFLDRHFKPLADFIRQVIGLFNVFNDKVDEVAQTDIELNAVTSTNNKVINEIRVDADQFINAVQGENGLNNAITEAKEKVEELATAIKGLSFEIQSKLNNIDINTRGNRNEIVVRDIESI